MYNLETSLDNLVYRDHSKKSGVIVEIFIKSISSTMFGHLEYYMDDLGPTIAVLVPPYDIFNSDLGIWLGEIVFFMDAVDQSVWKKYVDPYD